MKSLPGTTGLIVILLTFGFAESRSETIFTKNINSWKTFRHTNGDLCIGDKDRNSFNSVCIAGEGADLHRRQKLTGWLYTQIPTSHEHVTYYSPDFFSITLNGRKGRYLVTQIVNRYTEEDLPAIPGYSYQTSSGRTRCYSTGSIGTSGSGTFDGDLYLDGYGSGGLSGRLNYETRSKLDATTNCSSTPGEYVNVPTIPGEPGGYTQEITELVIDCRDLTYTYRQVGGASWQSIRPLGKLKAGIVESYFYIMACNDYEDYSEKNKIYKKEQLESIIKRS